MHGTRRSSILLLILFTVLPLAAMGGPPFVTDDPETPALNGWEVNLPYILEQESPGSVAQTPLFDINYGYRKDVQLKIESAVVSYSPSGGKTRTGIGDTVVGVKWRFREETKSLPQIGLYPQVSLPTGDAAQGLGAGKPSYILPVLVEKNWGKWTSFANVGYVAQTATDTRNYWYYGAALLREVTEHLEVGCELYGNSPADSSSGSILGYNIGFEYGLRKDRVLLFSIGRGLDGSTGTTAYLGLQMVMGPHHSKHHHHPGRTGPLPD